MIIWTIGHSTRQMDEFLSLLTEAGIECVIDVRTTPYSKWAPQFLRGEIALALEDFDIKYFFMGSSLGGLREVDPEVFEDGIDRAEAMAKESKVVLMCSEKDARKCHRHTKLEPELIRRGFEVIHLGCKGMNLTLGIF